MPLAFVLADPAQVVAASLHVRTRGQPVYERVELVREHDIYLRGALPAALVAAPGVEYFVETIGADGSAGAAYASDAAPATIEVDAPAVVERFTATFNDDSILELSPGLIGPSITRNSGIIGEGVDMSLQHLADLPEALQVSRRFNVRNQKIAKNVGM